MVKNQKWMAWIVVFAMAGLIFWFSSQNAEQSDNLSKGVLEQVTGGTVLHHDGADTAAEDTQDEIWQLFHTLLRKSAHFTLFCFFGIMLMLLMNVYGVSRGKRAVMVLGIGFLYACTDEFHQLFVPGRSAQWTDILLDSMGVATGIFLYLGAEVLRNKLQKRK